MFKKSKVLGKHNQYMNILHMYLHTSFSVYLDTYWHGLRFLRALILLNLGDVLVYLRVINTSSAIRLTKLATIVTCTVKFHYQQ